ncbi:hypothetical protein [Neobacillus vireti]|uniref:Aminodeoxychorismate lyase n=1 Tax=Neobacillus vireti LMG 21834 TaxID=1131730 RepID=A0AB94IPG4_9BACI|nr:hypothetical protein [Neobacillus vireti]ETI68939.1 hypothetical protein BAVI_09266 [Neobacillus vireti LMG 21834]KLT15758.1 aminodeoxychorismate lyase [Neobacillus vireti]
MRINLLSSFAAGILIATTISGIVYFSSTGDAPKTAAKISNNQKTVKVQTSEKEMKQKLETKGYVVQSKAEYDKNMKAAKASVQKQAPADDKKPAKEVTRVVVNVSDGMTSIDVGKSLEKAKLIPNGFNFSMDVEKKGLDKNLRPGTYVVDSEMSTDQMITTIFK